MQAGLAYSVMHKTYACSVSSSTACVQSSWSSWGKAGQCASIVSPPSLLYNRSWLPTPLSRKPPDAFVVSPYFQLLPM